VCSALRTAQPNFSLALDRLNYQFQRKARRILLEFNGSAEERQVRRLWGLFGWFVVVEALITVFGVITAPLLLSLAIDAAVGLLVIRTCMELRARFFVAFGDGCPRR
jgi:hypothetical protein